MSDEGESRLTEAQGLSDRAHGGSTSLCIPECALNCPPQQGTEGDLLSDFIFKSAGFIIKLYFHSTIKNLWFAALAFAFLADAGAAFSLAETNNTRNNTRKRRIWKQ